MNFIRLPSLRLDHRHDKLEKEIGSYNYQPLAKDSSLILPPKWRSEQPQQPQQYIATSPTSSIHIKLKYPQQSYAQEMVSFPLRKDSSLSSSSSSSSSSPSSSSSNRFNIKRRKRLPHSYASMIAQAILTSKEQKMTLRDIYNWVQEKYPHLYETNEIGWQNTIRHNLSLNRCFYKLPKSSTSKGKGSYWTIDKQQLYHTTFGRFLLDTYSSSKGFEYWSNESPLSSSSSFIMDIDEEKDINQNHHTQTINNNNSQPSHYLIQPSNLITLQHHQQHLNQYPSKSISSSISISSSTSSNSSDDNNIHFLKSPTFHPNSLHFILN